MIEQTRHAVRSRELALGLYDKWVHQRQRRPDLRIPQNEEELKALGLENFVNQLAKPRRIQLEQLREVAKEMSTADVVALLVMMELPVLETSSLLHKLSAQLMGDPEAVYFSKVNQSDNCGCGCGCGCAAMINLSPEEQIAAHLRAKPFSIDPFNEVGLEERERDALRAQDFLQSYGALSNTIAERVNSRYFELSRAFGG